jgi:hypothetical protein
VRAKTEAGQTAIRAGERARVKTNGAVQTSPLERSEVSLPASKQNLRVFHPGLDQLQLAWEGPTADYRLELFSDAQLSQRVLAGLVHDHAAQVPIPARGSLFWKVSSADGKTEVAKGGAAFAPEPLQKDLARLRNEVQDGSDKTTIFFQDKPPAVTFLFKPEPGAAQYRLRVFKPDALATPIAEKLSKADKIPLDAGALAEGNYLWEVAPLSATGEPLRGGRMNKLELSYDNSVPSIVIKSPKNGDVVRGSTVGVSGVAPLGTRVFANGKPLPLDSKHRFDGEASPVGRPPLIIFRTARASGAEVITVRTLRRAR